MKTGNPIVDAISEIRFEGIKIPHRWLGHPWLCKKGKRAEAGISTGFQLDAAYVLAEICYFYTAKVTRDAEGHDLTIEVRFDGEIMYQDYAVWAAKLGLSKIQLQRIIYFLESRGLIGTDSKPVIFRNGTKSNNMPHIWPIAEKIRAMTTGDEAPAKTSKGVNKKVEAPQQKSRSVSTKSEIRPNKKDETVQYVQSVSTSVVQQQPAAESTTSSDEIEALAEQLAQLRMPINEARRHARDTPDLARRAVYVFTAIDKSKLSSVLASLRSFFKEPVKWDNPPVADSHTNGQSTPKLDTAKIDATIAREETSVYESLSPQERAEVDREVDRGESFSAVMERRYNIRVRATDIVARALKSGK